MKNILCRTLLVDPMTDRFGSGKIRAVRRTNDHSVRRDPIVFFCVAQC